MEKVFDLWTKIYSPIFKDCPYSGGDGAGDIEKVLCQVQNAWDFPKELRLTRPQIREWLDSISLLSELIENVHPPMSNVLISKEAQLRAYRLSKKKLPSRNKETARTCALDKVAVFCVVFPATKEMGIEWDCPFWVRA